MKRAVLIANRCGVFDELRKIRELELVHTCAVHGSPLHEALQNLPQVPYSVLNDCRPELLMAALAEIDFDVLISNGCPAILPVSRMRRTHQTFVNVHPSLLPELRGQHPANGALLRGHTSAGATMHFMDDRIDAGRVIHQERFPLSDDLDLGLLYRLLFATEARTFAIGMRKLLDSDFKFAGVPQDGAGSSYRRDEADMRIDLAAQSDAELVLRIRAFGVKSQGVSCTLDQHTFRIYEAQPVRNPALLALFTGAEPATIVYRYDGKLLVRTRDGLLRVTSFAESPS